jgi:hypothetical protein
VSRFIDEHRGRFGVEPICSTLGVSASSYYQRATGVRSVRAVGDERLLERIERVHAANYCCYGYRRSWLALKRVKRAEWDAYWAWLIEREVVRSDGRTEFRRHFDDTRRQDATPRPGLRLQYRWPLADAEALDDTRGRYVAAVRSALTDVIDALGEDVVFGGAQADGMA